MTQARIDSTAQDPFLARVAKANDLAPTVGSARTTVPVTIGGETYMDGIAAVPLEDLALCSAADYGAMRPAHRSHRSRRLRAAAKDGTLSAAHIEALQRKGVLPVDL